MNPLKSHEIFGNWATLLLPIDNDDQIDYELLEQEIDFLIDAKVNGIYSNGTAGEFYNQTEEEFDAISSLLAEKCNKAGMPFQIGCSHPGPIVCLQRVKRAVCLKPSALQITLPDWSRPSMKEVISYLQRLQEVATPIGLVLYNPPHAKKRLEPEEFLKIKEAGIALVGCKVGGGDEDWYRRMKSFVPELSLFVPGHHLATGITRGAHGAYSNVACLNPVIAQQWYELMLTDMPVALEWEQRIQAFMQQYIAPFIAEKGYSNQAADKLLAAVGGWSAIGTKLRWPYCGISEEEVLPIREACKKIIPEFFNPELYSNHKENYDPAY